MLLVSILVGKSEKKSAEIHHPERLGSGATMDHKTPLGFRDLFAKDVNGALDD